MPDEWWLVLGDGSLMFVGDHTLTTGTWVSDREAHVVALLVVGPFGTTMVHSVGSPALMTPGNSITITIETLLNRVPR